MAGSKPSISALENLWAPTGQQMILLMGSNFTLTCRSQLLHQASDDSPSHAPACVRYRSPQAYAGSLRG